MIPVSKPIIAKNTHKYVNDCIKSGWISFQSPYVKRFEEKFAKHLGVRFAITTNSGTSALHLALAALKVNHGDEIIIPTFTMAATAFAVVYTGATPVLVDCEIETWNIDISQIENKITKKTRAILPVHIYGHPVDMELVIKIARKHKLYIIEDAAEGLGAEYLGKKIGTFGDMACFSFYANKIVTCGEGGMVVTNNPKLAERLKLLRDMAYSPKKRFLHTEVGFNYRMGGLQAALGLAQLEEIDKTIKKKRAVAHVYNSQLARVNALATAPEKSWASSVYWVYGMLVNNNSPISKEQLRKMLLEKGIDSRDFFIPMHRQPALKKLGLFKKERYPVADYIAKHGLYIPSGPNISNKDLKLVYKTLKEIYGM